jgi:hypothetical protein
MDMANLTRMISRAFRPLAWLLAAGSLAAPALGATLSVPAGGDFN